MFKTLFVAGLAALAAAQSTQVGFDSVPAPAKAGQAETIAYHAADASSPVTIILRKGASGDLQTISTLTSSSTGGKYVWTPASDLADGSDYALQITQGSQTNYYGPFSISGGSGSASSSASSMSMSASSSGLPMPAGNSSSWISTTSCPPGNATVPATVPASMGTGSPMSRNSTMVKPTLSTGMASSATGGSTNTNGAGFQGSSTGPSTPKNSNSAATMTTGSSVAALVLSGVAAFFFA